MEDQRGTSSGGRERGFLTWLLSCLFQKQVQKYSPSIQKPLPPYWIEKLPDCNPPTSKELPHLPDEILVQILRCLDPWSLKNARLTCRRWAKAGAHSLFRCIYFAPRTDVMNIFTAITENPVFALNITDMVYDSRLFQSHMEESEVYYKAFKNNFPTGYPKIYKPKMHDKWRGFITGFHMSKYECSRQRYISLLKEQNIIFEEERDFVALCVGLKHLPNLRRLSILDHFEWQLDCDTWLRDDHFWYYCWSKHALEGIAPPSSWTAVRMSDNDEALLGQNPWDFRGIDNVLKAALLHALNLRELLIGCQNSYLSVETYSRPESIGTVEELVPRLSLLKLDLWNRNSPGSPPNAMDTILQRAHHLKEIHLSTCFSPEHLVKKWSQLRVLDLAHGFIESTDFEAVIRSCASTLRELWLIHVHLYGGAWEDCSRDLGSCLQLHFVAVSAMTDDASAAVNQEPFGMLKLPQSQNTARNFMSNVSQSDLGFVSSESCYQAMAWHKGEFMINSRIDFDRRERHWNHDMPDFTS